MIGITQPEPMRLRLGFSYALKLHKYAVCEGDKFC